jgi:hypothetical protein
MIQLTEQFREKVAGALMAQRQNFDGSDADFARIYGINSAVFNSLKNGRREGLLKPAKWLNLGRTLDVSMDERRWNTARTDVFAMIEEEVLFCKEYSKGMIFVDECGIGKSHTAKYLSRTVKNCFYIDASQCKDMCALTRAVAKAVGVNDSGRLSEVKADTKYYLRQLPKPVIIVDEAGDLKYSAFLYLKEMMNGTERSCGWYLMGADGLREKMERGKRSRTVGFAEMFSRLSERYSAAVPFDRAEKLAFYRKLITDVLSANMVDRTSLDAIVRRCLTTDETGHIGGLRRAESLLILNSQS